MDLSIALNTVCHIDNNTEMAIQRVIKRRILPKGAILLSEGQIMNEVHYVEQGLTRAFYYKGKKEITSWMASEGHFIWPIPSYLLKRPARENIQLMEPTTLLSISRQDIEQLKQDYPILDILQCRLMERYFLLTDLRMQILLLKAEERFEAYQQLFPELYQRVPLRYIATYLGIDPATLSRVRGGYKRRLVLFQFNA